MPNDTAKPTDTPGSAIDTRSSPAAGPMPAIPGSSPSPQILPGPLPQSALRVARLLSELGHDKPVVMLPDSGKTSAEAAAGLGCQVAQIAKSIIFRRISDDAPVLVIASGVNRVDEAKVARHVGALAKADARFVREKTGYAIGGVCPIGHAVKPVCLLDEDLFRHGALWAAAGHPHAVFELSPAQLQAITQAPVANFALQAD